MPGTPTLRVIYIRRRKKKAESQNQLLQSERKKKKRHDDCVWCAGSNYICSTTKYRDTGQDTPHQISDFFFGGLVEIQLIHRGVPRATPPHKRAAVQPKKAAPERVSQSSFVGTKKKKKTRTKHDRPTDGDDEASGLFLSYEFTHFKKPPMKEKTMPSSSYCVIGEWQSRFFITMDPASLRLAS